MAQDRPQNPSQADATDVVSPLVSIVVPTYNAEVYLNECLDSLIGQTYRNIEIIVVDDGSTDVTLAMLQHYAENDDRITILQQEHAGGGAARNRGIDVATGDYLYFLDADDYADTQLLEKVVARIERDGSDIVVFPFYRYDERVKELLVASWGCRTDLFPGDVVSWRDNPGFIFEAFHIYGWNKVFRRSLVEEHHLRYQDVYLAEDLMFTGCALVQASAISPMQDVLVIHREGIATNLSSNKDMHPFDFISAFKAFKRYLEDEGLMDDLREGYCRWAMNACLYNLHTMNTFDTFSTVYQRLMDGDANELGVFDIAIDAYPSDDAKRMLEALSQRVDAETYLYSVFLHEEAQKDLDWYWDKFTIGRLDEDLQRICAEAQQLSDDLYSERVAHAEAQKRLEKVQSLWVYKVYAALRKGYRSLRGVFRKE